MTTKFRGFRALGILGFAALAIPMVSACNGNGSFTFTDNSTGSAATSTTAPGTAGKTSGTGTGHSGVTTPPATAPATTSAPPATDTPAADTAGASNCLPANLTFALGDSHQTDQAQWTQTIDMTNSSSAPCTIQGAPDVDLIGATDSQPSYDWTLTASTTDGVLVTLRPGDSAHFDLRFLSGTLADGGANENVLAVQKMVIKTPGQPDEGDSTVPGTLDMSESVVLQDGATHPGTYVTPVASGS